jgi:Putative transmembrane protein (PGPGW)
MLRVARAARVVTGSILIIVGLIAIPLPLTPGLPLIILGLAFGFSWHPKGLRLLRKCKVKWGRLFKKKSS